MQQIGKFLLANRRFETAILASQIDNDAVGGRTIKYIKAAWSQRIKKLNVYYKTENNASKNWEPSRGNLWGSREPVHKAVGHQKNKLKNRLHSGEG